MPASPHVFRVLPDVLTYLEIKAGDEPRFQFLRFLDDSKIKFFFSYLFCSNR